MNIIKTPIIVICSLLFAFTGIAGCGSGFVPLRGKVTFSDDGSPLTTGFVYFDNGTEVARGKVNADGTYTVGTMSKTDGLAPGLYKVYVQAIAPDPSGVLEQAPPSGSEASAMSGIPRAVSLVDAKFTSADTSGLECNVDRSTKSYDIVVERSSFLQQK